MTHTKNFYKEHRQEWNAYMRNYRRRKKEDAKKLRDKIQELKQLASQHHIITTSMKLTQKIKEL